MVHVSETTITDTDTGLIDGGNSGDINVSMTSTLVTPGTENEFDLSVNLTATEISEDINIAIVIDQSGSTSGDSGTDFDGDGVNETILEAQLYAAAELFQAWVDAGYDPSEVSISLVSYSTHATDYGTFDLTQADDFAAALHEIGDDGPGGWTNYADGLNKVNQIWSADPTVSDQDTNLVVFMSDGYPFGSGDYEAAAQDLGDDFGTVINAIGVGSNSSLDALNAIDNTAGGATQVTSGAQLLDTIVEPLIPVDFAGFEIYVDGEFVEFIPLDAVDANGDPVITQTPTGWTLENYVVDDYVADAAIDDTLDVSVKAIFGQDPDFQNIQNDLELPITICFVAGTRILTPNGQVPIEDLCEGDRVITRDHGVQVIRWIGATVVAHSLLRASPKLRPILLKKDALGPGLPANDLRVSRQHRFLIRDWRSQVMFGDGGGVLTPAFTLCNDASILQEHPEGDVVYVHMVFDNHEVIYAEGVEAESFHPTRKTVAALAPAQRDELFTLFPQLETMSPGHSNMDSARSQLKAHEGSLLAVK